MPAMTRGVKPAAGPSPGLSEAARSCGVWRTRVSLQMDASIAFVDPMQPCFRAIIEPQSFSATSSLAHSRGESIEKTSKSSI
jgi:hypothetical protein